MLPAVFYAIPAFVLLVVVEALSYRFLPDDDERGYELRDTATSMSMGAGSQVIALPWKAVTVVLYAALFAVAPWQLSPSSPWTWVLLFFADDLAYGRAGRPPSVPPPAAACGLRLSWPAPARGASPGRRAAPVPPAGRRGPA